MGNFLLELLLAMFMSFIAGFTDAYFKDKGLNATYAIFFGTGFMYCAIIHRIINKGGINYADIR